MEKINLIELLKIVLIGIIEGITEWLPISSTGHMLLFDSFIPLNATEEFKEMFFVVIQLGAILAVFVMFRKKMIPFGIKSILDLKDNSLAQNNEKKTTEKKSLYIKKDIFMMWVKVAVACIPSAILGLVFDDFLEKYFGNTLTISIMLIFYGILFIVIEYLNKNRTPKTNSIDDIGYKTAIIIGLFQVLSMIPGTSRSGATIIGALIIGVSRVAAAEFTFFLAIPTMLGASTLKIIKFGFDFSTAEILTLILGSTVAFTVSVFAIKFLMNFVKRHDFKFFGYYRIALGIIVLAVFFLN